MKSQVLIDWLTFTVLTTNDPREVITDTLKLDPSVFEASDCGRNGYKAGLQYDNITVLYDGGRDLMGVCVTMSGNGCRTYEQLGGDVLDLTFRVYSMERCNLTRLDIACDDKGGALDMPQMERYYKAGQIRSGFRRRQLVQQNNGSYDPACTIYLGSRKSDLMFRIYDKAKEHYDPQNDIDGYNSHWIRVEMQTRHEVTGNAIRHIRDGMVKGRTLGECVAEIIGGHIQFIEPTDRNISRCAVSGWWLDFLDTLNGVKITGKEEEKHVLERKLEWFWRSIVPVASTLTSAITERGMLELLAMGYMRRSKAQRNMLKVFKADANPNVNPINGLGNRVMRQIEKNFRLRLKGILPEDLDIFNTDVYITPADREAPPPRWRDEEGRQEVIVNKVEDDLYDLLEEATRDKARYLTPYLANASA
jgi:phage replication initiation protein